VTAHVTRLEIATAGRGTIDLTPRIAEVVAAAGVRDGLCNVFVHHTSASLIVSENADPLVRADLERFLARLVPDGEPLFRHVDEGPDDMPARVRSVLTQTAVALPIAGGRLDLGTWQGVYLWEHRRAASRRRVTITIL
jgi:secondary thiamine-phosphate synthase enzyme